MSDTGPPLTQSNRLEALKLALDTVVPSESPIETANTVLKIAQWYLDFIERGVAAGGETVVSQKRHVPNRREKAYDIRA